MKPDYFNIIILLVFYAAWLYSLSFSFLLLAANAQYTITVKCTKAGRDNFLQIQGVFSKYGCLLFGLVVVTFTFYCQNK